MTKHVQIVGHSAEVSLTYVGFEREVTVDVDNQELRLHDGTTPGGFKILNRDQNDNRYQARSVELDGLLGWEPNQRGFTVRRGPSDYRLRAITVNEENLVVTNGDGYLGSPILELAPVIQSQHIFGDSLGVIGELDAMGGVVGNLTGNVVGNLAGNVVGNVTGNLAGNAVGNHTGSFTGNLDTSGSGVVMADAQILLSWLAPEIIQLIVDAGLPVGSVVAFSGTLEEIPNNWFVCDGTYGTPDLRGKFIRAVAPLVAANSTGGTATHTHAFSLDPSGAHSHTGNADSHILTLAESPAHIHGNGVADDNVGGIFFRGTQAAAVAIGLKNDGTGSTEGLTESKGGGLGHVHTLTIDSGGAHTHSSDLGGAGTLPPYYAMLYIMKGA